MGLLNAEAGIFTACNGEEVNKLETRFIILHAKLSGAVYCYWSYLCVGVCGSVTTITLNCVHRSSPNWVCRLR